ncbi:MAG: hypothetical protein M3198_05550 [Actinomycetota bacterium]|nr:hypothetical protein [Actinomycetota bacterium]
MKPSFRRNAATVAVAVVAAAITANAPAIAHGVHAMFAHNSDKVDGLHAVASKASRKKRRGKLVATSPKTGRLPNDIIKKAPNANKLDGLDSLDFLGIGDTAADSEKLDGLDSTDFVKTTDSIDAETLDGKDAADFVERAGEGIWLVQGDVSGWASNVGSGSMTSSPDVDETTFTSTSTSGNATHFIVPDLPLAAYGKELRMAGIEICYDASTTHLIEHLRYERIINTDGSPTSSGETVDATDRSDDACRFYEPSAGGLSGETTVSFVVESAWTSSGANLSLGRVTFMLESAPADATPLS